MNYARNTNTIRKHLHDHQENLCIAFFCTKHFLMKDIFIQGTFNNIQGLLWKIQGLFKDIPLFFNFQGLFKDMMLSQGLFKARANHGYSRFCITVKRTTLC